MKKRKWTPEEVATFWKAQGQPKFCSPEYCNKDDANLVVHKPNGLGWTLNFGNPWVFILIGIVVTVVLGVCALCAG